MVEASPRERDWLFRLYEVGAYDGVIAWFEKQPSSSSFSAELLNLLGLSYARKGEFLAAASTFQVLADLDASFTDVHFNLAVAHWKLGSPREASQRFRHAIEQDPKLLRAWVGLGRTSAEAGEVEHAIAAFVRAFELGPDNASIFNELGSLLRRVGELDQAEACLSRAASLSPNKTSVLNALANVLRSKMKTREAKAAYDRALAVDPTHVDTLVNLASLQKETGHLSAALSNLKAALKNAPNDLDAKLSFFNCSLDLADWSVFELSQSLAEETLIEGVVAPPFQQLALEDNPARQLQRPKNWAASKFREASKRTIPARGNRPQRLRIGYFSADVRQHPAMQLFEWHLRSHDRSRFEVSLFSYGPCLTSAPTGQIEGFE